jgi:hypothetical protein
MPVRRRLLRWTSWFALVNTALLAIVGLRYLWYYATLGPSPAWVYAILAYIGHLSALACIPILLLVPVGLLIPWPRAVVPLGVVIGSAVVSLLLLDSLLFAETRYHIGVLTFTLLEPQTWAFLALYFVVALAIEAMLAQWVWRRTEGSPRHRIGRYLALGIVGCFLASHLIHLWAEAHFYVPVTSFTRYLPLYAPLRDSRRLVKLGLVDQARAREESMAATIARRPGGELHYPQAELKCEPRPPVLNVLLIVVDGMRADALTPVAAPRLAALAPSAARFDNHWSGGNVSRPGMFSLFYGLPATYWKVFADVAQPPVLMDLFRQYGYEFGIFASSPVYSRVVGLDRTALARIPNLRLETISPHPGSSGRDRTLTDEWLEWIDRRDQSRLFFGFLFYNAAVANEPPKDYPPAVAVAPRASIQGQLHARYLTAVHYVDSLVGRVLDDLERRKLLERTVVVVTSDHGMEFDDSGLGFDGHGTGFTRAQLQTPLLIRWPGRPPGRRDRRTSHFDVAPTLVAGLFGCTNPPSDYASGHDLFTDAQWAWLIATDYTDYALIEPDRVTVVLQDAYEIRDRNYRLIPHPTLPRDGLRAALREMSRFYR